MSKSIHDDVYLFLDGELSGEKRAAFSAHLDHCPQCRKTVDHWRTLKKTLFYSDPGTPDPYFSRRVMARLKETPRPGWLDFSRDRLLPWGAALICSLVLFFFLKWNMNSEEAAIARDIVRTHAQLSENMLYSIEENDTIYF